MNKYPDVICEFCGSVLREDDIDYDFTGKMDIMYHCDKCDIDAIGKIRFGKLYNLEYYTPDGEYIIDWEMEKKMEE